MEDLVALHDRSVLVTGHTGFKGGWLTLWLATLGARVHGYALDPPTKPSLFEVARLSEVVASDSRADVANLQSVSDAIRSHRPEVVFHLAAQPLVREGLRDPLGTVGTNVLGTATVLEAVRRSDSVRAMVVVTSDKVYDNLGGGQAFSEGHQLGGNDPYSASKAAAELVAASYRTSYFGDAGHPARIATARAGNVIGGGDWADDRLVPDCLRAFGAATAVRLRNPSAVRPWQHVLDPIAGYLALAVRLLGDRGPAAARAWNFGPESGQEATVEDVARMLASVWGDGMHVVTAPDEAARSEAHVLRLDSTSARQELGWRPQWSLRQSIERTVGWHRSWLSGQDMQAVSRRQIAEFTEAIGD